MKEPPFPTFSRFLLGLLRLPGSAFRRARGLALRKFDAGLVYRQLGSMLRGGVPLPQAVGFLTDEFRPPVAARLAEVRDALEGGAPFSAALGRLPASWVSPEDRAAIAAGERAGRVPEVLDGLAADREREVVLRNRVRSAMAYPTVVLALAAFVVVVVLWRVAPTYSALYASLWGNLPLATRVLIAVANTGLHALWIAIPLGLLWFFRFRGQVLRRLPVFRTIDASLVELRFARLLSLLLASGVPLDEALALCEGGAGRPDLAAQVRAAAESVRGGRKPSEALRGLSFLSPVFLWFLAGAEERGDFVAVTGAAAETAEERYLATLDLAQRITEPLCIALLGVVVGFLVVACYGPMFRLISVVGY